MFADGAGRYLAGAPEHPEATRDLGRANRFASPADANWWRQQARKSVTAGLNLFGFRLTPTGPEAEEDRSC